MEHLTKQQITLVAILVSLVTSLATGIVTVSLMDQNTPGVTNTINRVVERTIEKVVDPNTTNTANTSKAIETITTIVDATEKAANKADKAFALIVSKSNRNNIMGSGVVIDSKGTVAGDITFLPLNNDYIIIYQNGSESAFEATTTDSKIKIFYPKESINTKTLDYIPLANDSPKLGKNLLIIKKEQIKSATSTITSVYNSIIETVLSTTTIRSNHKEYLENGAYLVDLNGNLYAYKINDLILTNDLKKYIKK